MTKRRRSIRLQVFDYSDEGFYFVTICTAGRNPLFGRVIDEQMELSRHGHVARRCIREIRRHDRHIRIYSSIIMPDHVHLIIHIRQPVGVGAQFIAPACIPRTFGDNRGAMNRAPTLGSIVRAFKARCSNAIHRMGYDGLIWQRNYHERIIRNEWELFDKVIYIKDNPKNWKNECRDAHTVA